MSLLNQFGGPGIGVGFGDALGSSAGGLVGVGDAREALVHRSGVVNERGHNRGGLLEVVGLGAVVDIRIGVVGAAPVLDGVLDELEAGQSDLGEGDVVGAPGAGEGEGLCAGVG